LVIRARAANYMIPVKRVISVFIGSFLRTVFVYMSATLKSRRFQSLGIYNAMKRREVVLGGGRVSNKKTSTAMAQIRGHANSVPRMGMRGAFTPRSIARMPRAPMMNPASGLRPFNRFNDGHFDRGDRFRRFHHFNKIIFIGDLGFPWWWGPW